ncbi:MAG: 1-(5-phosphoribosyl)-5-[(5-phosphoribosylamino)methylideneamino]imidazole-4-carboxamide isomerase [Anaerolineaceae bacterium]|nr:1-(5-phosphoribosyl)-5-[(5-phosphoribosylamino)methylideneamino]imidazole-4-carboxamide isomerase [Anaerolineaceae bacterium]
MNVAPNFTVYPAIDLRGGQVVRLQEGDPTRQTAYSSNPASVAWRWLSTGAKWLHVVNLDGAFDQPDSVNTTALRAILSTAVEFGAQVQFGGGLRSLKALKAAFDLGVSRAVLGTVIVEEPELVQQALQRWGPERIAAGLDARDGLVRVRGWQQSTPIPALQLAQDLRAEGLDFLIFTDIARDGLQTGINLSATRELAQRSGLNVIASGGVRAAEDVQAAREANLAGIIMGRALYEGTVKLEEVL